MDGIVDDFHAKFYLNSNNQLFISDNGSSKGLWYKVSQVKTKMEEKVPLKNYDVIRIVPFYF